MLCFFWQKMFSRKNYMYVLFLVQRKHKLQEKLWWSTKNKLNITEIFFQTSHIQQTIAVVLHTKKIFFLIFKVTSKQSKTSMFSTHTQKKKKKKERIIFMKKDIYIYIYKYIYLSKQTECKYWKGKTYIHLCL